MYGHWNAVVHPPQNVSVSTRPFVFSVMLQQLHVKLAVWKTLP